MANTYPKYQQIKDHICRSIRCGDYQPYEKIPTEHELTEQFSVSRMTTHKALRDLVNEGLLVRYPGQGTFVKEQETSSSFVKINNFVGDIIKCQNSIYRADIIQTSSTIVTEDLAFELGFNIGETVFNLLIVHYSNNEPIQLEERYVNAALAPDFITQDFTNMTTEEYLSTCCPMPDIDCEVEAIMPTLFIKGFLQLNEAESCLQIKQYITYFGELLSTAKLIHPSSLYTINSPIVYLY